MKSVLIQVSVVVLTVMSACSGNKQYGATEVTKWRDDKAAAVSITYDDASINQFRQALPIMDTLGFKGTFFINTADIPDSRFAPKFIGRPLREIVAETVNSPTNAENLFERASALRFLNIDKSVEQHNQAGSLYEQGKNDEAFRVVDQAFASARRQKAYVEKRPVLLDPPFITWPEIKAFAANGHEF